MILDRDSLDAVLIEVADERDAQDKKWGEQNHPDIDRWVASLPVQQAPRYAAQLYGIPTAEVAKAETDASARAGDCSWAHIAVEELAEAIEAAAKGDVKSLRAEVLQFVAAGVQWVQAIDRRAANARAANRG